MEHHHSNKTKHPLHLVSNFQTVISAFQIHGEKNTQPDRSPYPLDVDKHIFSQYLLTNPLYRFKDMIFPLNFIHCFLFYVKKCVAKFQFIKVCSVQQSRIFEFRMPFLSFYYHLLSHKGMGKTWKLASFHMLWVQVAQFLITPGLG